MKLTDTRWLAHEHCVKSVKASYSSIVLALGNIYETSHEPEAHGLSKALSSHSTIAAKYLLDYILPQVAKLSRALLTKHLDLSLISSLVDATLNSLDAAILPLANWVYCYKMHKIAVSTLIETHISSHMHTLTAHALCQALININNEY